MIVYGVWRDDGVQASLVDLYATWAAAAKAMDALLDHTDDDLTIRDHEVLDAAPPAPNQPSSADTRKEPR